MPLKIAKKKKEYFKIGSTGFDQLLLIIKAYSRNYIKGKLLFTSI